MLDVYYDRDTVYQDTADIYITTEGNDGKDNLDINCYIEANGERYTLYSSDDFNGEEIYIENLSPGERFLVRVTVYVTWTESEEIEIGTGPTGEPITDWVDIEYEDEDSTSFYIYTRPTSFRWKSGGLKKDDFIHQYITASKWDQLADHAGEYWSWYDQEKNYNIGSSISSPRKGDIITAEIFNKMQSITSLGSYNKVYRGDLITADLFNKLIEQVNDF